MPAGVKSCKKTKEFAEGRGCRASGIGGRKVQSGGVEIILERDSEKREVRGLQVKGRSEWDLKDG